MWLGISWIFPCPFEYLVLVAFCHVIFFLYISGILAISGCWFVVQLLTINSGLHGMIDAVRKQKPMGQVPSGGMDLWLKEDVSDVHVGVGCDSCGVRSSCHFPFNTFFINCF